MNTVDFVPGKVLDELLQLWKSSIDVADIGGKDRQESVRAFVTQKCIEELEAAMRPKSGLHLIR
jgi:rRNA-processing protein FCF1